MESIGIILHWRNRLSTDFPCLTQVTLTRYAIIVSEGAYCIVDTKKTTADAPFFVFWLTDAEPRVEHVVRSYDGLVKAIRTEMRARIKW